MPKSPLPSTRMIGHMPVIDEDALLTSPTHPTSSPLPPPPPSHHYSRPKSHYYYKAGRPPHHLSRLSYPPPTYRRSSSRDSSRSSSRSSSWSSSGSTTPSTRSLLSYNSSNSSSGASTPRSTYKRGSGQLLPITTPVEPSVEDEKKINEDKGRRRRWYIIVGIVFTCLIVGLSVGLTMDRKQTTLPTSDTPIPPANIFPSGSFAFTTALVSAATNCTSAPATWRCYPYQTYSQNSSEAQNGNATRATYFWTISPRTSYSYQISAVANPYSPQFTNVSMDLLDGNSANERFVFNYTLVKTVAVDSENGGDAGGANKCTYAGTVFRATLWTRKTSDGRLDVAAQDGNDTVVSNGSRWADWPGEVEVAEIKRGGAECVDEDGKVVPVKAGEGTCECLYANFGL
ncbi:hypothetical protein C8035_v011695 [Colletotrichum spinosum]|uniref:Tat pathway signal sequence n=1 Tax=Colletotrichum spinosum TaxID=1347390 RepID=A0A4R8Q4C0_9PEZI|nr:hypothetical protein C8035_v011695 [Colletotrichum spinosum]